MKIRTLSLFAGLLAFAGVQAAAPAAPKLTVQAYVNGALNVGIWLYESAYPTMTGAIGTSGLSYDVQMKGPGETDFTTLTSGWGLGTFNKNSYVFHCIYLPTNYIGAASLRIRAKNTAGETSDWVETDPLTATVNVRGQAIYGAGCNASAFDGRIDTFIDGTGNSGNDMWTGYLFPEEVRIKGIRYLARLDSHNSTIGSRYRNSFFQIASDASFSDATNVHQVPSDYDLVGDIRMTEVMFDEPVTCRAIRHWKLTGGYEQSDEVEFIPADPPFRPTLAIQPSDVTNFHPVVTWTVPPEAACTSCRLERSFFRTGPFTPLTGDLDPATDTLSFTDTGTYVGVPVYYRVTGVCGHPLFENATLASYVTPYTRMRRLDREWGKETTLLSGIRVLPGTNGVMRTDLFDHTRCFDGNTSTFVDEHQDRAYYPPIGLNFDVPVWVGGFGYICRNDNICYARVKNTRLYAANDYPALLDRVPVSDNVARYSQDTTFYYQACTTVPENGATCYFLFYDGEFYGNVAELMFFGWTEADVLAAPIATAPKSVTFARTADGLGLNVSWTAGANATGYLVERRVRGTEAWTEVATTAGDVLTCVDADLAQNYYEYRVTTQAELGTAASDPVVYPFYIPADGTGLSGVVGWPYSSVSAAPAQLTHEAPRGPEAINLDLAADAEVAPGVAGSAHLAWEGRIVLPFQGTYTFTLETDAGGAVFIDDASIANSWTGGTKTPSGGATLAAGEHAIRVDYRVNENGQPKRCVLRWSGAVADEIVPVSQLFPSAATPTFKVDDYTVQTYTQNRASHVVKRADGKYVVTATNQELGSLASLNLTALVRPWTGGFDCFMRVETGNAYGKAGVLVQNADGVFLQASVMTAGANASYGFRAYDSSTGKAPMLAGWKQYTSSSDWPSWVRLTRRANVFTMYWKKAAGDEWQEIGVWTDTDRLFARDVHVGMSVGGNGDGNPAQLIFSNVVLKPVSEGTVLTFR